MSNKLKIEDTCLTVEQSKELQALGVEMEDTIKVFCDFNDQIHEYELIDNFDGVGAGACEIIPTLTNSEMLEMIPKTIKHKASKCTCLMGDADGRKKHKFFLNFQFLNDKYTISYVLYGYEGIEEFIPHSTKPKDGWYGSDDKTGFSNTLIRDSLFEMIKYLKTNNLM